MVGVAADPTSGESSTAGVESAPDAATIFGVRNGRVSRWVKLGAAVIVGAVAAVATAIGRGQAPVELKVGDMAPPFTLQGSDGKTYALADYRGKQAVVLAWFPKAFTGG